MVAESRKEKIPKITRMYPPRLTTVLQCATVKKKGENYGTALS